MPPWGNMPVAAVAPAGSQSAPAPPIFNPCPVLSGARNQPRRDQPMSEAKMAHARDEDAHAQIARLRAQVETLMKDRVGPALSDVADRAEHAMGAVRGQAEAVSGQIKEQPLLAVLAAAAIGFVLGRITR